MAGNNESFPFWRGAIYNAKTALILKAVGEDLANFKNQSDFIGDKPKLTEAQLATLRKMYSEKIKKYESEAMPPKSHGKPKFKK